MGKATIHPTAIVHPKANLGEDVVVGPYAIVDEHVEVGATTQIQSHAVIRGHTQIGEGVNIFPFAVVGVEPQHLGYKGEPTRVQIGNRVTLRESVTVHRGTLFGRGATKVGDDTYLMAYVHVAHDCLVGKRVIIANSVNLAGHAEVEDFATIGGNSAVIQHCRVGRYAYVGGGSMIRKDLAPFLTGKGSEFRVQGLNLVGLSRSGFSPEAISQLKKIYRIFFLQKLTVSQAMEKISQEIGETDETKVFRDFIEKSKVGLLR